MSEIIENLENKIPEPKLVRRLEGKTSVVHQLILSPDERTLVGIGNNPQVHLWDVETGELLRILELATDISDASIIQKGEVAWTPDSKRLFLSTPHGALSTYGERCHFWQKPGEGKWKYKRIQKGILKTKDGKVTLYSFHIVTVSSDGFLFASLYGSLLVFRLRKWRKPKLLYTYKHHSEIRALALSPNGKRLVIANKSYLDFFIVSETHLDLIGPTCNPGMGDLCDVRWLNGETLISATKSGSIGIFKNTSVEVSRLDFRKNLRALCLVDEETIIACVSDNGLHEIHIMRLPDLEILHTMKGFHEVDSIVLYGNGRFMAVSDSQIEKDHDWMKYAPAIYDFGSPNLGRGNPTVFNPLPV